MTRCCDCCLLMLWARAMRVVLDNDCAIRDTLIQRTRDPNEVQDRDFFRECAWTIYVTRTRVKSVSEIWARTESVFLNWDYQRICRDIDGVRTAANGIRIWNSSRKADAVIEIAQWMCREGWDAIKKELLSGLTQDAQGNYIPTCDLIQYLDRRPMIGETNAIFILKNIGYDVAKPDKWLRELAEKFDYPGNTEGVQMFASDISGLVLERISVVETVLWNAVSSAATSLSFTCHYCGRQRR